jgi:hypothetical protein
MTTLSKRELLLQLLELEGDKVGDLGKDENISKAPEKPDTEITITETAVVPLTKPKKQLTEKQLEALKKGQEKRDENRKARLAEMQLKKEEEKRIIEEKLVKKAIAVKKKQIKKQALLEEISDDEQGTNGSPATPPLQKQLQAPPAPIVPAKPRIIFYS